jgi:putative ABC transport system substrate-binding protein
VDVILTSATGATQAAKRATSTIPIVFAVAGDAIAAGLVESFERPGGNVTGVPDGGPSIAGKRLEVLKEAVPTISRVAVIGNATPVQQAAAKRSLEESAQKLGMALIFPEVQSADDFSAAFVAAQEWKADAYVTFSQVLTSNEQPQIVELARKAKRPLIFHRPEGAEAGALMSLNDDAADIFRTAAGHVAQILRGASPTTLAVKPSANPELVINLRTAKELGVDIPSKLLERASRVIQ